MRRLDPDAQAPYPPVRLVGKTGPRKGDRLQGASRLIHERHDGESASDFPARRARALATSISIHELRTPYAAALATALWARS